MNREKCLVSTTEFSRFPSLSSVAQIDFPINHNSPSSAISRDCFGSAPNMIISSSASSANRIDCMVNKRKRRPAGTPDPDAEVVSLSPKTLMESDRYICEICNQGFQRDQNLQMHRRRHKVPWKLLKRSSPEAKKRVYVCPEPSCLHHDPCHALGDLVGIKKHYRRKHSTDKQWKCGKCGKSYAVQSDYKAHLKTCGTRGHCCDCGHVFSRVESFIEHQDNCSIAKEKAALGSSEQASIASLLRRNVNPSQSTDTISVSTWSGVLSLGISRHSSSLSDDCGSQLLHKYELQLLKSDRPPQKPNNDCDDLLETPLLLNTEDASTLSGYVQDPNSDLSLKLSIGLPSAQKSHRINSQAMPAFSREETHHNGELLIWNSQFGLKDLANQKKQPGDCEVIDNVLLCGASTQSFKNATQDTLNVNNDCGGWDHGDSMSGYPKLDSLRARARINAWEKRGFDILNIKPSNQSKFQDELKSLEADVVSVSPPNSWHTPTFQKKELEVTVGESMRAGRDKCVTIRRTTSPDACTLGKSRKWENVSPEELVRVGMLQPLLQMEGGEGGIGGRREAELADASTRQHSESEFTRPAQMLPLYGEVGGSRAEWLSCEASAEPSPYLAASRFSPPEAWRK